MIRVAILGASGYSALELIKLLLRHPEVEITALTTRQDRTAPVGEVHPSLAGRLDLTLENLSADADRRAGRLRVLLLAARSERGGRRRAAAARQEGHRPERRLSAQRRRPNTQKWYGLEHRRPGATARKPSTACRSFIASESRRAELVANPGCYPTSAILALAPLLRAGAISPRGIIIDSKSGVSGAGREPKAAFPFSRVQRKRLGLRRRHASPHAGDRPGAHRRRRQRDSSRLHAASDPDGPRHPLDLLRRADRRVRRQVAAGRHQEVLRRRAIRPRVADAARDEARLRHEFLRHHGPHASAAASSSSARSTTSSKGASGAAVQNFNLMYGIRRNHRVLVRIKSADSPASPTSAISAILPRMSIRLPQGFRAAGVYSGVKRSDAKLDLVAGRLRSAGRGGGRVHEEPGVRRAGEARPRADAERFDPRAWRSTRAWPTPAPATRATPTRGRWPPGPPKPAVREAGAGARDVDRRHRLDAADGEDSRRHQGRRREAWPTIRSRSKTPPAAS